MPLLSVIWEDLLASKLSECIIEELQVLDEVLPQKTSRVGIKSFNNHFSETLVESTKIGRRARDRIVNLVGIDTVNVPPRLHRMGEEDSKSIAPIDRSSRAMKVVREPHLFEEAFGGDHIELTEIGSSLPTIHEEGGGEGCLSVSGGMTITKELEVGVRPDRFLDTMIAKLRGDGLIEESVPVDHAKVLEL